MPRLLVIDDEPRVARALEYAFASSGIEVVSLNDAAGAADKAAEIQPDAILLDIGLKDFDGLAVCRSIKDDARVRDIPLLLLSGQADANTKAAGFAAGADDFVPKPFVPTELMARIEAQLKRRVVQ